MQNQQFYGYLKTETNSDVSHPCSEIVHSSGLKNAAASSESVLQILMGFFSCGIFASIQAENCSNVNSDKTQGDWKVFFLTVSVKQM